MALWDETFPDTPFPGEAYQGTERIDDVLTKVAYIVKEGCRKNVYDIKKDDRSVIARTTNMSAVQPDDDEEAQRQKALQAHGGQQGEQASGAGVEGGEG